jgi:mannose-1-phosphate guanylyltransferase/mannose-1-phosphate guanylyltransferase/mannose-6-phosphate isomerase
MTDFPKITPVILSGGAGTRLWPMSREDRPKQFLALTADQTMFELTLARVADSARFDPPIIVSGAGHAALVDEQLGGRVVTVILEPCARNTAPAIALAALAADPQAVLLIMPSDHVIADRHAFDQSVDAALPLISEGWFITFGIAPTGPETGYGYIAVGEELRGGVHKVARFVEKPDRARAEAMIACGDHVWNGGIFLLRADMYLGALAVHAPEMLAATQAAMAGAQRDGAHIHPDVDAFAACPSDSIDYAVMEKAAKENRGRVAVVPVSMGWSDIGSWDALYDFGQKDESGNVIGGDVIALDSRNTLIRSDGLRISVSDVSDLIIIASGNDVMILPRGASQNVKNIVAAIKLENRT